MVSETGIIYKNYKPLQIMLKRRPGNSKENCLLFNGNFPAEKAYRLLESILATKYSKHKYSLTEPKTEPKNHFSTECVLCYSVTQS